MEEIKVFRKVLKQVIQDIEKLEDINIANFQDEVLDAFDGYNYDGEDDVVGFEKWCDISNDGTYELNVKINHEDAYELTIFIKTNNGKITVNNVL